MQQILHTAMTFEPRSTINTHSVFMVGVLVRAINSYSRGSLQPPPHHSLLALRTERNSSWISHSLYCLCAYHFLCKMQLNIRFLLVCVYICVCVSLRFSFETLRRQGASSTRKFVYLHSQSSLQICMCECNI